MSQVIVNSHELRRFARFLLEIEEEIRSRRNSTAAKLDELKHVWRDQRFADFEREYNAAAHEIDQFLRVADAYARYLEEKARRVDTFLQR